MTLEGAAASLRQVKPSDWAVGSLLVVKGRRGQALAGRTGSTEVIRVFIVDVYFPLLKGSRPFGTEGTVCGGVRGPGTREKG